MTDDRYQRLRRARPVLALAGVAFAIGAIVGAQHSGSPTDALAASFVRAWTQRDYATMYGDLATRSQRTLTPSAFASAYEQALRTATATRTRVAGGPRTVGGDLIAIPVRVQTRLFGTLSLSFELRIVEGGEEAHVAWSSWMAFPGLRPGEQLARTTTLPRRATLLARDGSVLAESTSESGEGSRTSPLGSVASALLGSVGPVPASRRVALEDAGVPPQATVGVSGLEEALDARLRGAPGGELEARSTEGEGARVLAVAAPRAAAPVRTTVSPAVQQAAVTALGGQYGGIVALEPATGEILAVAGLGLEGLQPPGSTFKMITTAGVLEAGVATRHSSYPFATYATLDGVKLNNANGEECGGTLEEAFAVSCNSVFAPLGVKLGAARLVATAEKLGFNHKPQIAGAAESTLPAANQIQGELDVGSTAIGQGEVLASPLEMALVASTIADGGVPPRPTFLLGASSRGRARAISASVARTMRELMIAVVREGTGTAAAIPGVVVAGKTGTAELKTQSELQRECPTSVPASETSSQEAAKESCKGVESEAANTDAWFAAFAPATHPRVAVCVLLVKDGAGGATAAPVAREVLEAELKAVH